jgi:hypothetical protein
MVFNTEEHPTFSTTQTDDSLLLIIDALLLANEHFATANMIYADSWQLP